jgi:outer membrane lipoprotein-sorting protein
MRQVWLAVLVAAVVVRGVAAQGKTHLETVLGQMDAASARFQSAEADFQWDFYERVTKSTSSQTGTIFFQRQKGGATEMGARMVAPTPMLLSYKDGLLQVFDAKQNTLLRAQAHGNQGQYEGFLTLGFGGSGKDLESKWAISDQGMETVDGVACAKLDLVSKDANVKTMFTHVTIWVDTARDVSLKQAFFTPSDDVRTTFYRNIRLKDKVDKKGYEITLKTKPTVTNR